jgi:hypothetical protein
VTGFLYIAALALAALSVSVLGAAFSVFGLMRLFAGAPIAVAMMASALEFSKLTAVAFLHRTWRHLNPFFRAYLLIAVAILSCITSMGIFGFLSDAYQSSAKDLLSGDVKIESLQAEQTRNTAEIERINRGIEEIPSTRVSKKVKARQDAEPRIRELTAKSEQIAHQLEEDNLKKVDLRSKIGPLFYVAAVFHQDADTVVKWLISVFVVVFDPLAICLVIATSEAHRLKGQGRLNGMIDGAFESKPKPKAKPKAADKDEEKNEVEVDVEDEDNDKDDEIHLVPGSGRGRGAEKVPLEAEREPELEQELELETSVSDEPVRMRLLGDPRLKKVT